MFVDNLDTTVGHIGEIQIPIDNGTFKQSEIVADYYNLDAFVRHSDNDITLFKNGGGAHLDLITSRYILECWKSQS